MDEEKLALDNIRNLSEDSENVETFLRDEYSALLDLYTHTENTLYSIFNFYLTLLSAITGAAIVLMQLNAGQLSPTFPTMIALLVFLVLLGIITQDAVVNKNVDLAQYARAMNVLKDYLLRGATRARRHLFYQSNILTKVGPMPTNLGTLYRWHRILTWMTPLGTHQLFISLVNSFSLTAIILILSGMVLSPTRILRLLAFVPVSLFLFYVAHCVFAKWKFGYGMKKASFTMTGEIHRWGKSLVKDE